MDELITAAFVLLSAGWNINLCLKGAYMFILVRQAYAQRTVFVIFAGNVMFVCVEDLGV